MIGVIGRLIQSQARRPPLQGRRDKGFVKEYVTPYEMPLLETYVRITGMPRTVFKRRFELPGKPACYLIRCGGAAQPAGVILVLEASSFLF